MTRTTSEIFSPPVPTSRNMFGRAPGAYRHECITFDDSLSRALVGPSGEIPKPATASQGVAFPPRSPLEDNIALNQSYYLEATGKFIHPPARP